LQLPIAGGVSVVVRAGSGQAAPALLGGRLREALMPIGEVAQAQGTGVALSVRRGSQRLRPSGQASIPSRALVSALVAAQDDDENLVRRGGLGSRDIDGSMITAKLYERERVTIQHSLDE